MAKNKSKKKSPASRTGGAIPLSPARFMTEKARSLPIGPCYISDDETGLQWVIVTRRRGSGNLAEAMFLIDRHCLGVKDIILNVNLTESEFSDQIEGLEEVGLEPVSYAEAHNLVLGALDFREEAGLADPPEWGFAQYILDEDTDDIPIIEYDFGIDGKHVLQPSPYPPTAAVIDTMRRTLGDDFVNLIGPEENDSYTYWAAREADRHPKAPYIEPAPFPTPPPMSGIKHREFIDELASCHDIPSKEMIDRAKALVGEGITRDFNIAVLNEIAETRDTYYVLDYRPLLFNIFFIAMDMADEAMQPAVEQLVQLSKDFHEYHFGDVFYEVVPPVVARAFASAPFRLAELILRPGILSLVRTSLMEALAYIPHHDPSKEPAIREMFNDMLRRAPERIADLECFDALSASGLLSTLHQLKPDDETMKLGLELFDQDLVDLSFLDRSDFLNKGVGPIFLHTTQSIQKILDW